MMGSCYYFDVSGMLILLFPFSNFKIENCHGAMSGLRLRSRFLYQACECSSISHFQSIKKKVFVALDFQIHSVNVNLSAGKCALREMKYKLLLLVIYASKNIQ